MSWEVRTMQSKTSFFNPALFRKDLSRFWPLWTVYAACWLLALPVQQFVSAFGRYGRTQDQAEILGDLARSTLVVGTEVGLIFAAVFGVLFAMALFSYLTAARSVGMFHSFPIRREGLFLTHYLAGAAVFAAVQVLSYGLAALVQLAAGGADWRALGAALLGGLGEMLFFYSFGVLCAMFTGQILAIPAFYGILNILAYGLCDMIQSLAGAFYFGYNGGGIPDWIKWLTPIYQLSEFRTVFWWDDMGRIMRTYEIQNACVPAVYAAAGLVLAALALAVYRRRSSETAGDTVAVSWAKPVFLFGVAFCSALSLGQGLYYFTWDQLSSHEGMSFPAMLLCMVLLGLVGYFAAAMLLKKSFKVLRTGWRGAAVLTAALLVLGVCVDLDVLGVEDRIPAPASVESVTVSLGGRMGGYGELADPAAIEQIVALHGAVLEERDQEGTSHSGWLELKYHLKNGGTITRSYYIADNSTGTSRSAALYRDLATSPAFQRANMLEDLEGRRLAGGELRNPNGYASLDAGEAQIVYDALVADIDAGHFGTTALMGERAWAEITYVNELSLIFMSEDRPNSSFSRGFTFTSNCTNLIAALEEVGAVDGENPLQTYMELYPEDYADVQPAFSDQELADQAVLTRVVG